MKKIFPLAYLSFILVLLIGTYNALGYSSNYYDTFPTILVVILLVYVTIFIVWLAVAYWVYKDAKKRGLKNAALWGVVAFFGGLIGILIYLVLRNNMKPDTPGRFCTSCGRTIPFDANICPYCGKRFETYF